MERVATIEDLLRDLAPRVERALVATFGVQTGLEAAAAALSVGWERGDALLGMDNPAGYLYTVGRNHGRRTHNRRTVEFPPAHEERIPDFEPGLHVALAKLTEQQRRAVVLVHCFGYSYRESAETLGISLSSLRNHVSRGLMKLRVEMGVDE